jgi:hypothetical protein
MRVENPLGCCGPIARHYCRERRLATVPSGATGPLKWE